MSISYGLSRSVSPPNLALPDCDDLLPSPITTLIAFAARVLWYSTAYSTAFYYVEYTSWFPLQVGFG